MAVRTSVEELADSGAESAPQGKSGPEAVEDNIKRDPLVPKGKSTPIAAPAAAGERLDLRRGFARPRGQRRGSVKSLHPAAMRKPTSSRGLTQRVDPFCYEHLGRKGIREGGPDTVAKGVTAGKHVVHLKEVSIV